MKWALLAIGILIAAAPLSAQAPLGLAEVQRLALENYQEVRRAEFSLLRAERAVDAMRARRLPRLDATAGYTHISETAQIDLALPGLPSRSISFGDGNVWESALTASVPLFTGFRLDAMQNIAQTQSAIAREALAGTRTALRHRVAVVYRQAQLAHRSVRIYREQLQWLQQQLRTVKQLHGQGQVIAYDTLLLSTRISALLVEKVSAETAEKNALLTLSSFILRPAEEVRISEDITLDETLLLHYREGTLGDAALARRSDFRLLEHRQTLVNERIRAERADYFPTVNAFASYRYGRPGVDQFRNEWMDYYTAGVNVRWQLWSWGGDRAEVEQQRIALQESEQEKSLLRSEILTAIEKIINEIEVLQRTRVLLDEQVRQQTVRQQLLHARFAQGLATATEVVDAETALTTARLQREQSEIRYAIKLTELAAETGWNE
ncbi:MAG: TolC family protein [Bacteroidota bacterium]|nr:TolC family protein [Bacteroidota bacterium]